VSGGARSEHHGEAGEVGHGGHQGHLHADLDLTEEASKAGAEAGHARDLSLDYQALPTVVTIGLGVRVGTGVDEERFVRSNLDAPGGVLARDA